MVLIFGWGSDAKDLGEVAPATCPNCHNQVFLHEIRSQKRVSLYFVPLVPYGSDLYLACPICRQGLQLRTENRNAVAEMRVTTSLYLRGEIDQAYYLASAETFWRRVGVAPSGQQIVRPPSAVPPLPARRPAGAGPPAPAPPAPGSSGAPATETDPAHDDREFAHRIDELARLHRDGVLTDGEFAAAKRRILGI